MHNVLATVVHLKLAVDWNSKSPAWKDSYMDARFVEAYAGKVDKMKLGRSTRDFRIWYEEEKRSFKNSQQDIITARNWTLALYKEVSAAVLTSICSSRICLVWIGCALGSKMESVEIWEEWPERVVRDIPPVPHGQLTDATGYV